MRTLKGIFGLPAHALSACALMAGAFAACGNGASVEASQERATAIDTTLVISGDLELGRQVAGMLPGLADRAGLELVRPVRVEWRTRAELEDYLRVQVDEELPPEEATRVVRSYALLGLVPPTLDLREVLLDLYLEQVAGFYDPDSTALWVMDDQDASAVEAVLLHELVHAVQDQATPLDSLTREDLPSDVRTAAQAAIEGHATLVMIEAMLERNSGQEVDLSQLPDLAATLGPTLQAARSQFPALASVPRILQESLLFPYLAGAGFVLDLWAGTGGRPAPLGSNLPLSTEQILHPERFLRPLRDDPVDLALTSDDDVVHEDQLGELGLRVFADEHLADSTGALAVGWGGDRFVLQTGPEGDALTWVVVWDEAEARDAFVAAVRRSAWSGGGRVRVEADLVGDRPASWIRVGPTPDVVAVPSGPSS